jgi:hypothetical protein
LRCYHNLNCNKIYEVDHTHTQKKIQALSTFDILILTIAMELQLIQGNSNVTILSFDKHILTIASLLNIKN